MKKQKKKIALPRRQWRINPVTRVKPSDKLYSRARIKQKQKNILNEEV